MSMRFINKNKDFLDRFREKDVEEFLLVETSNHPVINHSNAVTAKMVARAKGLRIAWIESSSINKDVMLSYSANSVFLKFKSINLFIKFWFSTVSIYYYAVYVLFFNRVLSFKYKKISYGDFIYDSYLAIFSMATFHRFDFRIVMVFYKLLSRDAQSRFVLKRYSVKALLVANYIGLSMGPLFRVAVKMKIPAYVKTGGHTIFTLALFNDISQVYDYPLKPTAEEMEMLYKECGEIVKSDFEEFIKNADNPYYGTFAVAYNNKIVSNVTKEAFLKNFGLKNKPIIFVMLHAFNDYPRSHFKRMLFNDYYCWFKETYSFALADKNKNWIFKEHPANSFYPTKDLDLNAIFKNLPEHVKFVSCNSEVNASTVLNVADTVITCIGTAGMEMPAMRGIPSVIAGDTFFGGFGFTVEPGSKKEYFEILSDLKDAKRLTFEQELKAKSCFLYINRYCKMSFMAGPAITYEEASTNLHMLRRSYQGRILEAYEKHAELIYEQFNRYTTEISKSDFKRLVRLPAAL